MKSSTYVVGDIHGWKPTLDRLMAELPFRPKKDRLWLVGDLVNRGPDSLAVLRWAREMDEVLGDRFVWVLGNHDLHLLASYEGIRKPVPEDLRPILDADDGPSLIEFLRRRPLLHRDEVNGDEILMVHAGLWPNWTLKVATHQARKVEILLRDRESCRELLSHKPTKRLDGLQQIDAQDPVWSLYAFTSMRTVRVAEGQPLPTGFKGPLSDLPRRCKPWFRAPGRPLEGTRVVFGHWAALGLHQEDRVCCLDSGCAWGGDLTAMRLEDGELFKVARPL